MLAAITAVPKGKVTTYGAIAQALKTAPRAVGQALKMNPFAPEVPCHRVVATSGNIGGFHGNTSGHQIDRKNNILKGEGVVLQIGKKEGLGGKLSVANRAQVLNGIELGMLLKELAKENKEVKELLGM